VAPPAAPIPTPNGIPLAPADNVPDNGANGCTATPTISAVRQHNPWEVHVHGPAPHCIQYQFDGGMKVEQVSPRAHH